MEKKIKKKQKGKLKKENQKLKKEIIKATYICKQPLNDNNNNIKQISKARKKE